MRVLMLWLVVPGCQHDRPASVEATGHERADCSPGKDYDPGARLRVSE
jgi:hypothetical protein